MPLFFTPFSNNHIVFRLPCTFFHTLYQLLRKVSEQTVIALKRAHVIHSQKLEAI